MIRYSKGDDAFIFCAIVLFSFLMIVCLADQSWAKTWYADHIDPNRGIQTLIHKASFGDIVLVGEEYTVKEEILLKEGVTLAGSERFLGRAVISGEKNKTLIIANSNTCIRGLVIRGGDIGIHCGVGAQNIIIDHNLIIENRSYGIKISHPDSVKMIGNTIAQNGTSGIAVQVDPNHSADPNHPVFWGQDNIIGFNGSGLLFYLILKSDTPPPQPFNLSDIFWSYNDIYDSSYRVLEDEMGRQYRNKILDFAVFGPGNFSADPCFKAPDDYHFSSYSPCIDSGDPNSDYSLEPIPNGERVNLGFYGNTDQAAPSIDSDDDGLYDPHEGVGDLDNDGLADWEDTDTAIITLPWGIEKLGLHLQGISPDSNIGFKAVKCVGPSDQRPGPPQGLFPFNAVQFRVADLDEGDTIWIRLYLPKDFDALEISQYMTLSTDIAWSYLPFEIDPNEVAISFQIQDGLWGDRDGIRNGEIEHLGGVFIPSWIDWENPQICLISIIDPCILDHPLKNLQVKDPYVRHTKDTQAALFCIFCIIVFGCLICFLGRRGVFVSRWFTAFLIIMLVSSSVWAQEKEDIEITSSPNPVGSGARALGMGGAFIGVADDATAASWNPAGLKHLINPEVSLVTAYSSRKEGYQFEKSPEASGEYHLFDWDVNYLSVAYPGRLFQRNFVISFNYQHLYDFSKRLSYHWRESLHYPYKAIDYKANYAQSGGLRALSPSLAVIITPRLTLGISANIWPDKLSLNEWIIKDHMDGQGQEAVGPNMLDVAIHVDKLERYRLRGLNFNLGLLWDISETFTLGLVYKTPFKARIRYTHAYLKIVRYPENTLHNTYEYNIKRSDERLSMPSSYGIGLSYQPLDQMVIDFDFYQTQWGDYELIKANGRGINPITGYSKSEVHVKPTHQVRLGAEYAFISPKSFIPTLRAGCFYDPEPGIDRSDDFYGVSLGLGLLIREKRGNISRRGRGGQRRDIMSIDMAYQYRWGKKAEGKTIKMEESPADVDHHLFYISLIYYINAPSADYSKLQRYH